MNPCRSVRRGCGMVAHGGQQARMCAREQQRHRRGKDLRAGVKHSVVGTVDRWPEGWACDREQLPVVRSTHRVNEGNVGNGVRHARSGLVAVDRRLRTVASRQAYRQACRQASARRRRREHAHRPGGAALRDNSPVSEYPDH
eukprot:363203-Chlamydomonas_euryale.AAC.18